MTSWTAPRTYTTGEVLTKTILDTHVRDNELHLFEQIHSGSSTAGWTAFTPTLANITVGDGTLTAKKGYAGKTTHFYVQFTLGSTSAVGTSPTITFPDTAVTYLTGHPVGQAILVDAGTATYVGIVTWSSTTVMALSYLNAAGTPLALAGITSTVPFTWTTGDIIQVHGSYERA